MNKIRKFLCLSVLLIMVSSTFITNAHMQESQEPKTVYNDKGEFLYEVHTEGEELVFSFRGDLKENEILKSLPLTNVEEIPAIQTRSGWVSVIVKIVKGVVTGCTVQQTVMGWNVCNEVYKWLVNTKTQIGVYNAPAQRVLVYREYKRGRIPGCEPMHSAACNIGR